MFVCEPVIARQLSGDNGPPPVWQVPYSTDHKDGFSPPVCVSNCKHYTVSTI